MDSQQYLKSVEDYFYQKLKARNSNILGNDISPSLDKSIRKSSKKYLKHMYKDFPAYINPASSIILKIFFAFVYFVLMLFPIVSIFIARKVGNLFFQNVKLNPKETFKTSTHYYNRDKRFRTGYRNSFTTTKKKIVADDETGYWNLEDFEIKHNHIWFFILIIPTLLFASLFAATDMTLGIVIISSIIIGLLISLTSLSKNSKGKSSLFIMEAFTGNRLLDESNSIDDSIYEGEDYVTVISKSNSFPDEYKYTDKWIDNWHYNEGQIVFEGTSLFDIKIKGRNEYLETPTVKSPITGKLVLHAKVGTQLLENEKCCVLKKIDEIQLLNQKYNFDVIQESVVSNDHITNTNFVDDTSFREKLSASIKTIKDEFNGAVVTETPFIRLPLKNEVVLYIKFINKEKHGFFIEIKTHRKNFKLNPGAKINFLFKNKEILDYVVSEKSQKVDKDKSGVLYSTHIKISSDDLEIFSEQILDKWKIISDDELTQMIGGEEIYDKELFQRNVLMKVKAFNDLMKRK